jgi:hypothetical protein
MSSSLKAEIPTIIKTIPNGIVPNFLNFSWYEIVLSLIIIVSYFLKCYNNLIRASVID